ncbi:MAG: hypothetical protein M1817_000243 [Caeruleum heppii]|nr:MAG: hypothetical protein M1817_000243 [Caeruleum heppii]
MATHAFDHLFPNEIQNELDYYRVLLATLQPSADQYLTYKAEYEKQIRALEMRLGQRPAAFWDFPQGQSSVDGDESSNLFEPRLPGSFPSFGPETDLTVRPDSFSFDGVSEPPGNAGWNDSNAAWSIAFAELDIQPGSRSYSFFFCFLFVLFPLRLDKSSEQKASPGEHCQISLLRNILPDASDSEIRSIIEGQKRGEAEAQRRLEQEKRDKAFAESLQGGQSAFADSSQQSTWRGVTDTEPNGVPLSAQEDPVNFARDAAVDWLSEQQPQELMPRASNTLDNVQYDLPGPSNPGLVPWKGGSQARPVDLAEVASSSRSSDDDLQEIDPSVFNAARRLTVPTDPPIRTLSSSYGGNDFDVDENTEQILSRSVTDFDRLRGIQNPLASNRSQNTTWDTLHDSPNDTLPRTSWTSAFGGVAKSVRNGAVAAASSLGSALADPRLAGVGAYPSLTHRPTPSSSYNPLFDWANDYFMPGTYGSAGQHDLTSSAYESWNAREAEYYDYVVNDPTKTRDEIKSLLENIRPDVELPPQDREGTPEAMKYPLMEHQKLGLTWMKNMEDGSNQGGILADDMGLGKTIQALALLVSRPSADPSCKTTLIVAPVALMRQWEREIATKLKASHQLKTYILHGSKRNATWDRLKKFDVVLTTFGTLASEYRKRDVAQHREGESGESPNIPLLGRESKWYRVIIDEAQCIKNRNTKAAMGAGLLKSKSRFCLTGTPMMNNVGELQALISFLGIKPYNNSKRFHQDFTLPLRGNHQGPRDQAMRKLQALLKAVLLRRTKQSEIDGKPIISLPERTNEIQHAVFDEDQQAFYTALETQTQLQFNKYLRQGSVGRNYSNVLVLLLRLRQACCHPHLIQDFAQEVIQLEAMTETEMADLARRLSPEVVSRILEMEAFECPVCYDAVENPAIFVPCGHDTCAECFAKISDQSGQQGLAHGNETADTKCPTCRGKISAKSIIDYKTFKQVHVPDPDREEKAEEVNQEDIETESAESEETDSETDSLENFIVNDEDDEDYGSGRNPFDKAKDKKAKAVKDKANRKKDRKGKGRAQAKEPRKSLAELKREGMKNARARKRYMNRLAKDWVPSAKVDKCCEILEGVRNAGEGEKTIVFSQFTSLLDLLEVPIHRNGWRYKRYDGSMSAARRHEAVMEFTDDPSVTIMLVSLKAGNAGLNLVAASQVVILDPFWNPFIEEQAIDRTHRIGQMRRVTVHRILVQKTVEDRIIALQEKKRELIEGALDEKASERIGRLGVRELAFLFGVNHS